MAYTRRVLADAAAADGDYIRNGSVADIQSVPK